MNVQNSLYAGEPHTSGTLVSQKPWKDLMQTCNLKTEHVKVSLGWELLKSFIKGNILVLFYKSIKCWNNPELNLNAGGWFMISLSIMGQLQGKKVWKYSLSTKIDKLWDWLFYDINRVWCIFNFNAQWGNWYRLVFVIHLHRLGCMELIWKSITRFMFPYRLLGKSCAIHRH